MNQKVKKSEIPEVQYLWLLHKPKKLTKGHLSRPVSGSGPRRPDPTQKVRIRRIRNTSLWPLGEHATYVNLITCIHYVHSQS
jgi:hypothetical protein